MLKGLKEFDSYGHEIRFNKDGMHTYKSWFGFALTVLLNLGVLGYSISNVVSVFEREAYTLTRFDYKRNFFLEATPIQVTQDKFDMSALIFYQGTNETLRNSTIFRYISINFLKVQHEYLQDNQFNRSESNSLQTEYTGFKWNLTPIGTERCAENRFGDEIVGKSNNLSYSWCPKDVKFPIAGNIANSNGEAFQVTIHACDQTFLDDNFPGEVCAPLAESLSHYKDIQILYTMKTQYFDVNEFEENPMKNAFYTFVSQTPLGQSSVQFASLSENFAIQYDNIISTSFGSSNTSFINLHIEQAISQDVTFNYQHSTFIVLQNPTVESTERRVNTLVDLIQKIGGLYGALKAVSLIISFYIQKQLYIGSLVSQTVETNQVKSEEVARQTYFELNPSANMEGLVSRKRLQLSLRDMLCTSCLSRSRKTLIQNAFMKIKHELDIVEYIENMRKLKFIFDVVFNKHEKASFQFSKYSLVQIRQMDRNEQKPSPLQFIHSFTKLKNSGRLIPKRILKSIWKEEPASNLNQSVDEQKIFPNASSKLVASSSGMPIVAKTKKSSRTQLRDVTQFEQPQPDNNLFYPNQEQSSLTWFQGKAKVGIQSSNLNESQKSQERNLVQMLKDDEAAGKIQIRPFKESSSSSNSKS